MAQFKTQKFTFFAPRTVIFLKKNAEKFAGMKKSRTFATAIEKQTMFQEMPRWRNR